MLVNENNPNLIEKEGRTQLIILKRLRSAKWIFVALTGASMNANICKSDNDDDYSILLQLIFLK